ncbi:hypothetical protein HDU76_006835 [Blyttiomyces sp. JEL0837]|nr:hypothetical protein HDU76_006835 [Blyttiomyces sp. JEL0837]
MSPPSQDDTIKSMPPESSRVGRVASSKLRVLATYAALMIVAILCQVQVVRAVELVDGGLYLRPIVVGSAEYCENLCKGPLIGAAIAECYEPGSWRVGAEQGCDCVLEPDFETNMQVEFSKIIAEGEICNGPGEATCITEDYRRRSVYVGEQDVTGGSSGQKGPAK